MIWVWYGLFKPFAPMGYVLSAFCYYKRSYTAKDSTADMPLSAVTSIPGS